MPRVIYMFLVRARNRCMFTNTHTTSKPLEASRQNYMCMRLVSYIAELQILSEASSGLLLCCVFKRASAARLNLTKLQIARGIPTKLHVSESNMLKHCVKLNMRCSQNLHFIGGCEANNKFMFSLIYSLCDFVP